METVRCNKCGASYTDTESVEQARKWIVEGYAPCPNISCPGELEVEEVTITGPGREVLPEKEADAFLHNLQRGVFYFPQR